MDASETSIALKYYNLFLIVVWAKFNRVTEKGNYFYIDNLNNYLALFFFSYINLSIKYKPNKPAPLKSLFG